MTVHQIVNLLNDAVRADRSAVQSLLRSLVPCNEAMLNHPSIVCWGEEETGDVARVGILGVLNGIAALDGELIESVYDDRTNDLSGFRVRTK